MFQPRFLLERLQTSGAFFYPTVLPCPQININNAPPGYRVSPATAFASLLSLFLLDTFVTSNNAKETGYGQRSRGCARI